MIATDGFLIRISQVNTVSPGVVVTPVYDGIPENKRTAYFDSISSKLPVKCIGRPEDIAHTVLHLIENVYITGAVIDVDGGHRLI